MAVKPKNIIQAAKGRKFSGAAIPPRAGANRPSRRGSETPKGSRSSRQRKPPAPKNVPGLMADLSVATGQGGGKPPMPPMRSAPPAGASQDRVPMRRASTQATTRATQQARQEKFMGNAQVVRDAPPAPTPRSRGRRAALVAGGTLAAGVGLSARDDGGTKGGTQTPVSTVTGMGGTSPTPPSKSMPVTQSTASRQAPTSRAPAMSTGKKPSSGGRQMKGKELADFLGLKSDSAVRTYMETGKHKYPTKK